LRLHTTLAESSYSLFIGATRNANERTTQQRAGHRTDLANFARPFSKDP
jgi:hypothetical protein